MPMGAMPKAALKPVVRSPRVRACLAPLLRAPPPPARPAPRAPPWLTRHDALHTSGRCDGRDGPQDGPTGAAPAASAAPTVDPFERKKFSKPTTTTQGPVADEKSDELQNKLKRMNAKIDGDGAVATRPARSGRAAGGGRSRGSH